MNQTANTSSSGPPSFSGPTAADNFSFFCLGVPVVLVNTFILIAIIHGKGLLQKSVLLTGIVTSNLYLGVHMIAFGAYRYANVNLQAYALKGPGVCVAMLFPLLYPMAFNTGSIFLLLASLERLLAIATPHWYRTNWNKRFEFARYIRFRLSWMLFTLGHLVSFGLLILGLIMPAERYPYSWSCDMTALFGLKYITFLTSFNGLSGAISTILTLCTLVLGLRRFRKLPSSSGEAGRFRIQLQLAKSTATISCLDFALVALPSTLSAISNAVLDSTTRSLWTSYIRPQNSTYTCALNSILIIVALLVFNRRFRQSAIELLRAQRAVEVMGKMAKRTKSWCKRSLGGKISAIGQQPVEVPDSMIPQVESRF